MRDRRYGSMNAGGWQWQWHLRVKLGEIGVLDFFIPCLHVYGISASVRAVVGATRRGPSCMKAVGGRPAAWAERELRAW